jgi:hypothetical protein
VVVDAMKTLEDVLRDARDEATYGRGGVLLEHAERLIRAAYEAGKRDGAKEVAGRSHRVSDAWEDDG